MSLRQNNYDLVEQIFVPHTAVENAISRIDQCYKATETSSEPICIALIGPTRSGKSRALEYKAKKHPKTRLDDGLRVPILSVRTPSNPTTKGLAEVMLRAIGDPNPGKGSETNMTNRLITLLGVAETRMMMVDEFQHFYDKKSHKVMHHVADWLKLVVDESHVALVVSGLPSCQAVLNQNEQLAGRFMSPIQMPRFDWINQDLRDEFIGILGCFQEGLAHFDMPQLNNDEMAFRFYCASGGLIGYVAKILRQAVWNAIDANRNNISLDDLSTAHMMSVYVDEKSKDLPLSFNREFSVQVNEVLLQRVNAIGTTSPEVFPKRESQTRLPLISVGQILHK